MKKAFNIGIFMFLVTACSSYGNWEREEFEQFVQECQGGMRGAVGELQKNFCTCNAKFLSDNVTFDQVPSIVDTNLYYQSLGTCSHHISEDKMTEAIMYEMEELKKRYQKPYNRTSFIMDNRPAVDKVIGFGGAF